MKFILIKNILSKIWGFLPKWSHWYILWCVNPKFNIGVSGIILNSQNQLLLLKHVYRTSYSWGLPSGWVKKNESVENALKREVLEEVGIEVEIRKLIRVDSGFKLRIELFFLGFSKTDFIEEKNINMEIFTAKFFDFDKIPDKILPVHLKYINEVLST